MIGLYIRARYGHSLLNNYMIHIDALKNIKRVFLAMFFFSLYVALTGYVNSSFMQELQIGRYINLIYFLSALFAVVSLWTIPKIIQRVGIRRTMLGLLLVMVASLLGLITSSVPLLHFLFFLIILILNFVILYQMDVFLNYFSDEKHTGRIRGLFFTLINFTWAISSIVAGYAIDTFGMTFLYGVGAISVIITFFVFLNNFKNISFPKPPELSHPLQQYKQLLKKTDRKYIFSTSFLLHCFYAMGTIYVPYHLHYVIGFDWSSIGMLLLLANIPFLLLEYPTGRIADKHLGEQEMMIIGLIIGALGAFGFAYVAVPNFALWAGVLIVSRIGIALLETTTESYFFKIVDRHNVEHISLHRTATPFAYIFIPFLGLIISSYAETMTTLFVAVGCLLLLGIYPAAKIRDTK